MEETIHNETEQPVPIVPAEQVQIVRVESEGSPIDESDGVAPISRGRRFGMWLHRHFDMFSSGEILVAHRARLLYRFAFVVAVAFFIGIWTIFASLRLEVRLDALEDECFLLRERAVVMKERLYRQTSHAAIEQQLKERGIELYEPLQPSNVIR